MKFDKQGKLLEDFELGQCSPSFAGAVIMNQSINAGRACEKKSVNSVFYDYIFTYPALCIPE